MDDKELQLLAYELRNNWFTLDGQAKIDLNDERSWLGQEKFTPNNENGILFSTMYYYALSKLGLLKSLDGFNWIRSVELTRKPNTKGIFYRRKLDSKRTQSHDNVVALVCGALLFDSSIRFEIRSEIYRNCFRYQVVEGEPWYSSIIQGGDMYIIDVCCGKHSNPIFFLWFILGLLVFNKDEGQLNLARLRLDALQLAIKTYPNKLYNTLYNIIRWLFNKRYKDNHKSIEAYFGREGERNPYIDLMEEIFNGTKRN